MGKEIIRVQKGKAEDSYGIAIDIGTTTVVGYLCNLKSMEVVDTIPLANPQSKYGEDVMSRIMYCKEKTGGLKQMSRDIIDALNNIIDQAIADTQSPVKSIVA